MASEQQIETWRKVEAMLREVLQVSTIEPERRSAIEGWLDHNELGLAWEQTVEALGGRAPVAAVERNRLRNAADLMGIDPADAPGWDILEP